MDKKNEAALRRETKNLDFLRGFLREPEIVGSIIPSSRFLERRMIEAAKVTDARLVVELGPGTGGTSRSFLAQMPVDSELLTIELNQAFVTLLDEIDDPRLHNHCGSAADLESILKERALPAPDVVISGIPFSTLPAEKGRQIIESLWHCLRPGGRFVAYQFRSRVAELAQPLIGKPEIVTELRNIPPMRVYCWHKTNDGHSTHRRD